MRKKSLAVFIFAALLFTLGGCERRVPENAYLVSMEGKPSDYGLQKNEIYSDLSNKTIAWGLKKNKGEAPSVPAETVSLLESYGGVYKTDEEKKLYLTFDEGYENGYTAQILDTLKKTNVKAAFFITGDYLKTQPELVLRMADEGHSVGNHTYNHPSMPSVTDNEKLAAEILSLSQEFTQLTGKHMTLIRPPMGEFSERTLAISRDLGYKSVLWSFAYVDWQRDKVRGADYAYAQIMPYIHDGAVLLLHAVSKDNADVLERVILDLQAQGYVFGML